jgi:activator of HSP90 ATPase
VSRDIVRSIIQQSLVLPAKAAALYEAYLDPVKHAEIAGGPVTIGASAGAAFEAFDGSISGAMLAVVAPHLIVQSWRSVQFKPEDPDSTLILTFTPQGDEGKIDLVHLDVPEQDYQGVIDGWEKYYWTPWRRLLAGR